MTLSLYRGSELIHEQPTFFKNATGKVNYKYTPSTPIDITLPNDRHIIRLFYQEDIGVNDFIGGVEINPYFSDDDLPSILNVAVVEVVFELRYV